MIGFNGGIFKIVSIITTFLVFSLTPNKASSLANQFLGTNSSPTSDRSDHRVSDTPRLCPGCVTGDCATTTMVSGLPIVQLVVATAAGFIWAGIFIWLYASFYEGGTFKRSGENIWSWFRTPGNFAGNEEAEGMKRSSPVTDYTESGKNLIMITNLVLDAIHFLGDKFM